MDEEFFRAAPAVKAVFYAGGSVRYFVTEALWSRGVRLTTAQAINAVPVSEFAAAAIVLGLKRAWHLRRAHARDPRIPGGTADARRLRQPRGSAFLRHDRPPDALVEKPEMWSYSGVPDVVSLPDDYARQLRHGYYAAISYMDAQLGRVLDELDRLGLGDNTIVVLWGDHGWKLGEHDRWAKHSNVENDTRAPLLIAVPGLKTAGGRTAALVEFVHIYPTLADAAGLPVAASLEGRSLKSLLTDPTTAVKSAAFSQYPRTVQGRQLMGYSMRTDRYRLTRWVHRADHSKVDAVELYDHRTDPQENVNIAHDPANRALVEKLTTQWLAGWRAARLEIK